MKKFCSQFVMAALYAVMLLPVFVIGQNNNPRAGRASDGNAPARPLKIRIQTDISFASATE